MDKNYLVQNKPYSAIYKLAWPIIIGNLFQQIYSIANSTIVGRYVNEQALSAVGASDALTNIFISIAIGGGIGASVVIGKYYGAKDFYKMKSAIKTTVSSFLVFGVLLGVTGMFFSKKILIVLNTPADILNMAVSYLQVYFLGLPLLFMYNVLSAIFNALGESRKPLYFLVFSSLLNIILGIVLVKDFEMGIVGTAWATLVAQGVSVILLFAVFIKEMNKMRGETSTVFDKKEFLSISKISLPSILQQSAVSIGMLLVQSVVNRFGSQVLAGFSAAIRIESICLVPMTSIGNAMSSYTAQNLGANKQNRIKEGYRIANKMVLICGICICIVLTCLNRPIIAFFLGDNGTATALATGQGYLSFLGWFFSLAGFKMVVDGVLRGAGDVKMFTLANMTNLFIRTALSFMLAQQIGIAIVWYAVPIGWLANWVISYRQYKSGDWQFM